MSLRKAGVGLYTESQESGDPYDLSGFNIPFAYSWPTAPSTSTPIDVTAGNITSLQSAIATANAVVNVPAGTYNGNLTSWASNVDVVMDNAATLNGYVDITNQQYIRWTGGNIVTTSFILGVQIYSTDDVLFNNVNISVTPSGGNEGIRLNAANGAVNRVAFINSTVYLDTANGWGFHTIRNDATYEYSDIIFANVDSSHTSTGAAFRINPVDRFVIVDSVFEDIGVNGGAGMRMSSATDVFIENILNIGPMHLSYSNAGWPTFDVNNGTFNNIETHQVNHAILAGSATAVFTGSVIPTNCTVRNTPNATLNLTPFTSDGGGNTAVAWDGSTIVYSGMPGKTSRSDYGADH